VTIRPLGCLVDQLAGQSLAHACGLGHLVEPEHVRKTLPAILKYNWRDSFSGHFNNQRSYMLGDESGLLMADYPRDRLRFRSRISTR
jgi:non-lysosomal glucosylceramidase